jgi:hypothetical protein
MLYDVPDTSRREHIFVLRLAVTRPLLKKRGGATPFSPDWTLYVSSGTEPVFSLSHSMVEIQNKSPHGKVWAVTDPFVRYGWSHRAHRPANPRVCCLVMVTTAHCMHPLQAQPDQPSHIDLWSLVHNLLLNNNIFFQPFPDSKTVRRFVALLLSQGYDTIPSITRVDL